MRIAQIEVLWGPSVTEGELGEGKVCGRGKKAGGVVGIRKTTCT